MKNIIEKRLKGRSIYEITDENGSTYQISYALGKNIQAGSPINVKGYNSLIDLPTITDLV